MNRLNTFITIGLLTLFVGCAHGATSDKAVEILEGRISELETEVSNLRQANDHLCGALAESSMMGMLRYVGDSRFLVTATGQVKEVEDFIPSCHDAMRQYTEEVEKRKALIKAKEEIEAQQKEDQEESDTAEPDTTGDVEECSAESSGSDSTSDSGSGTTGSADSSTN